MQDTTVNATGLSECNAAILNRALNLLQLQPNKQHLIQFADLLSCCHQSIHLNFWVFILKGTFISITDQLPPEIPSKKHSYGFWFGKQTIK